MKTSRGKGSDRCLRGCACGRHNRAGQIIVNPERLAELASGMTQSELAAEFGTTRKVIRQRLDKMGISAHLLPPSPASEARHTRLFRARGKAKGHPCVKCDEPAVDWARIHTEDGMDPWADYVPLCRSCHIRYDSDARQNPVSQARWLAAASSRWTPEWRASAADRVRELRRQNPIPRDPATGRYTRRPHPIRVKSAGPEGS